MVGGEHQVRTAGLRDLRQRGVARFAGRSLKTLAACPDLDAHELEVDLDSLGQKAAVLGPGVGRTAQPMVHVHRQQVLERRAACAAQARRQVEQGHGVASAGQRQHHRCPAPPARRGSQQRRLGQGDGRGCARERGAQALEQAALERLQLTPSCS